MARVPLYAAEVEVEGVVDVVQVAGFGAEAILGRDVLNAWVATFDGPRRVLRLRR